MRTTIPVDAEIRDRLKTFGIKGDKYDRILERLMDVYERSLMTPAQIDAASPSESGDAEWVIERALGVLHGRRLEDE